MSASLSKHFQRTGVTHITERVGTSFGLIPGREPAIDLARRYFDDFDLDREGNVITRTGEDTEAAIGAAIIRIRDSGAAPHLFVQVVEPPASASKRTVAPLYKLSARQRLAVANGENLEVF